jgi:hypothetical protein
MIKQSVIPAPPPATLSLGVQLQQLTVAEVASATKLANLEADREVARTRRAHAQGSEETVAERQVNEADAQVNGENARLNRIREEIKSVRTSMAPPAIARIINEPPPRRWPISRNDLPGLALFLLALPLVIALAQRIARRSAPPAARMPASDDRLERLEHGMDSIAIEIERIGEAQRFQSKLMADRSERSEQVKR